MAAIIFFMVLLFFISFIYPAAVVVWYKLNGDKRTAINIIRKEC